MKKVINGFINGSIGIDFVKSFDTDGDGKVSSKELKDIENWINFLISTGTSILSILYFI